MWKLWTGTFLTACIMIVGCEPKTDSKPADPKAEKKDKADKKDDTAKKDDNKHGEWWCDEHGIPESECSMCSAKVAKECKAKGDWCEKHNRAQSQCFICDGSLMDKFAAKYEAKYGKKPPLPEANMPGKKDDKKESGKEEKK